MRSARGGHDPHGHKQQHLLPCHHFGYLENGMQSEHWRHSSRPECYQISGWSEKLHFELQYFKDCFDLSLQWLQIEETGAKLVICEQETSEKVKRYAQLTLI